MDETENKEVGTAQVTNDDLNSLREQIKRKDEETRALENALQNERKARQEVGNKLSEEVSTRFSAQESAIENAIVAAAAEIDGLEKQQTQLMEEGKFAEASKISRLIASAQYKLDAAHNQKSQFETYKTQAARQAETVKSDPLSGYSDPAKNWISKHPEFLSDRKVNAKVMAAHNLAVADDVEIDSREYFERLDQAINPKVNVSVEQDVDNTPVNTRQQNKSSSGAPVSRGNVTNSSGSGNGKRIQLTADQAEAALISFPKLSPQDAYVKYSENIQKLKESGRI